MSVTKFQRGRSTFVCDDCGRTTRETIQGQEACVCEECWEICGLQNAWSDGFRDGVREQALEYLKDLQMKGGNPSKLLAEYPDLFPPPERPPTVLQLRTQGTETMPKTVTPKGSKPEAAPSKSSSLWAAKLARPGTLKMRAAETLLSSLGVTMTTAELAIAVYGKPMTSQVAMVLKGIDKAIKVESLPLKLVSSKSEVTLSAIEEEAPVIPSPAPRKRGKKEEPESPPKGEEQEVPQDPSPGEIPEVPAPQEVPEVPAPKKAARKPRGGGKKEEATVLPQEPVPAAPEAPTAPPAPSLRKGKKSQVQVQQSLLV